MYLVTIFLSVQIVLKDCPCSVSRDITIYAVCPDIIYMCS